MQLNACPVTPACTQGCGPRTAFPGPVHGVMEQQQQQFGAAGCHRYFDIDQEDADDPMACTEYVNDIFEYLRESEVSCCRWVGVYVRWRDMQPSG